jgi:CMP/dCMP kinase
MQGRGGRKYGRSAFSFLDGHYFIYSEVLVKVIAVSRSYGSGGTELAEQLARTFGCLCADGAYIKGIEQSIHTCSPLLASMEDEVAPGFLEKLAGLMNNHSFSKTALSLCLYELALKGDAVIVGAGGHHIFADYPAMISLQVVRRLSERVKKIASERNLKFDDAIELVHDKDKEKSKFMKDYFDKELFDPLMFHLVVNLSLVSQAQAIALLSSFSSSFFGVLQPEICEAWLRNRLLEKKAEIVLFHLGLTRGPKIEFDADNGHLTVRGVVGGKHDKEELLGVLARLSEVTTVTDELRVEVLSRMLY